MQAIGYGTEVSHRRQGLLVWLWVGDGLVRWPQPLYLNVRHDAVPMPWVPYQCRGCRTNAVGACWRLKGSR